MDIRKLQRVIVDALEDVKAQHIVVFNTEEQSPLFERVIMASGTSNRQTKALASSVRDAVKTAGENLPRVEGEDNGEWIIVDCGAAVVHVMQPDIRDYYRLEEIWGAKPVRLKLGAPAPAGLVKASSDAQPDPKAKKAPAKKKAATPRAEKAAPAAKKVTAAKKAPAKKTSAVKAPAKKTVVVGKKAPAVKKAVAAAAPRKTAAAKAPAAKKARAR